MTGGNGIDAEADALARKAKRDVKDDDEIKRLAELSGTEYERERQESAERLGIKRVSVLDKLVAAERKKLKGDDGMAGRPIRFNIPQPWHVPVDGAELLTDTANAVRRYIVVTPVQANAIALWALWTHVFDAFDVAPKLLVKSATKRSGKTRLARVQARLVAKAMLMSRVSSASLLRTIELHSPSLLLDEMDAQMNQGREIAEALRGLINAGFDRDGAQVILNVPVPGGGYEPREFSLWAPQLLAGIGELPDTVRDRSIEINMVRKKPGEKVQRLRRRDGKDLDDLCRMMVRWAADNRDALREAAEPTMPASLDDRAADAWEPLVQIAERAGGDWPTLARQAATKLSCADKEDDTQGIVLLGDIRQAFQNEPELSSKDLVETLIALEGRPWAEMGRSGKPLTQTGLARLLKPFGIGPDKIGPRNARKNGYQRAHFVDAFERYLTPILRKIPMGEDSNRTPGHNAENTGTSDDFQTGHHEASVRFEKYEKSNNDGLPSGCPVEMEGDGGNEGESPYDDPWDSPPDNDSSGPQYNPEEHDDPDWPPPSGRRQVRL